MPPHPATELIRAVEGLELRENLLDHDYEVPDEEFEKQISEMKETRNFTPDQKLRLTKLLIELENEKEKLKLVQAETAAADAALDAAKAALKAVSAACRETEAHYHACAEALRQAQSRANDSSQVHRAV
ncbi:hypothetical protein BO82DRAFT_403394 [Aspergillus uvarum CBS 121591]|uniref:Uncharacterized protein n=1 Tax=Aspergillus uvarum CBS 121591 TaxID=1448315 RepID=A0A319CNR2_9EURO|nr:hypothetical protein BO82DRAFT_403394 [Aspergillus uvarum CBS 121591]PYH80383.1 hypothetical protein BO82DRAFT_403394 [Aspergillus uvarum CBS 121591]